MFVEVEAVADDEVVLDREADVVDLDVDLAARRLRQQARRPQAARATSPEDALQIRQRQAGIDDVLDDDDVAVLQAAVDVFQHPHFARRGGAAGIARHGDEVEGAGAGQRSHQIGQEEHRSFEHADEVELGVGRVAANLDGKLGDAGLKMVGGEQRCDRGRHRRPSVAQPLAAPRRSR